MPVYYQIYIALLALGVLVGGTRFTHLSSSCRCFWTLLIATIVVEITAWYFAELRHSNLIIYRLLIPIQYLFIALGYGKELSKYQRLFIVSIVAILIIWTIDFFWSFSIINQQYPTFVKTTCNLLIISWALLYLNTMLKIDTLYSFMDFPLFWLSLGWLVFSVVNLTYFATLNYLSFYEQDSLHLFDIVRIASNFTLYTLFTIAFLTKQKTIKRTT